MKRRMLCTALVLVLLLTLCATGYAQEADTAITMSTQRVNDSLRYLDEIYLEAYPELGLRFLYGTPADREVLSALSDAITQGLTTDREKAEAVLDWVARNIEYDEWGSAYPADTFYRREGNCLSYALLTETLLRLQDIPAVVCDGWRGDMELLEFEQVHNNVGHAWCFAYADDQWVLLDSLWETDGITDRDYIAKWYYNESVEFVTPVYTPEEFRNVRDTDMLFVYTDGRFMNLRGDLSPSDSGSSTKLVNNLYVRFTGNTKEGIISDGIFYEDGRDQSGMLYAEAYRDGWTLTGEALYFYAYENGIQADQVIVERSGQRYYCRAGGVDRVIMEEGDYFLSDGGIALHPGFSGSFMVPDWIDKVSDGVTVWESDDPQIASVDQNGVITAHKTGEVYISVYHQTNSGGYSNSTGYSIRITDEVREPDYTDHVKEPEPEPKPDPKPEVSFTDVSSKAYYGTAVEWAVEKGITNGTSDSTFSPDNDCTRGQIVTFLWRSKGSPEPASTVNPFRDVDPSAFYYKAVLWAVEQGITSGTSKTTFSPDAGCTRGQVATFLHRAENKPVAKTANPFKDVKKGAFYYEAVLWAVENGVTNGLSATSFGPDTTCTRGQIVTFLYRALEE